MMPHEQYILQILREAQEPLFASEIADRLNREGPLEPCSPSEVVRRLQTVENEVMQLTDGSWTLKKKYQL